METRAGGLRTSMLGRKVQVRYDSQHHLHHGCAGEVVNIYFREGEQEVTYDLLFEDGEVVVGFHARDFVVVKG
jgi:hypothetical protein